MSAKKTGHDVPCFVCGKMVYKAANYLARGFKKITCGDPACKSEKFMGANNPFWNRTPSEETRQLIKDERAKNPPKGTGPKKGIFKQTPEARAKMSEALRRRWRENRDTMLSYTKQEKKPREQLRYRRNFTPLQRREWKSTNCAWCKSTEKLALDHIIPVSCGGENERRNAQTLCTMCNLWKMVYVDRPIFLAGLGQPRAKN